MVKRLLYIAFHNAENQLFGVHAKILSHCRAFRDYGYQVDLIERQGANTVVLHDGDRAECVSSRKSLFDNKYIRSVLDKQNQIQDIKAYLRGKSYDACYIRYDFSDPGFISLLKDLRKVCGKIALELPTYPYDDENKGMLLSRVKLSVDQLFRKQLHKYVDFIVTFYGGHDRIFDIPVQVVPNGFDFSTMSLISQELSGEDIHVIAVSSMREWHGYERFLAGMHEYYRDPSGVQRNIVLHLVGNGREYVKYKELVTTYGLQEHVVMEGAMHGEKLDALYEWCALGIDSLARHRSGIHMLSSLKSREYGAKGIPMINSCKIDIFGEDFPWLLQVSADETPVNMHDVLDFYDRCFTPEKNRLEVGRKIRSYVEKKSGMKQTLAPVVSRFEQGREGSIR